MGTRNTADHRSASAQLSPFSERRARSRLHASSGRSRGHHSHGHLCCFPSREALLDTSITDHEFAKLLSYMQAHPLSRRRREPACGSWQPTSITRLPSRASSTSFSRLLDQRRVNSRKIFQTRRSPTLNPVADLLMTRNGARLFKKDDVLWEVAFALWAPVHGYVMLYRAGRVALSEKEFRKLLHRSIRRFLHGLKA